MNILDKIKKYLELTKKADHILNNLKEADEEAVDREYNFERFTNTISKLSGEGEGEEKEEIKIGVNPGEDGKYRRILMDRTDFDKLNRKFTGAKNIVNLSNANNFYIFANDKKVVITEYKDYPRQSYAFKNLRIIGKEDL